MFKDIKSLIYEKNLTLYPAEHFELELDENRNILKYTDNRKNNKFENVDNELVIEYFDHLFRIIDGWKNKYEDNSIMDGTEWKLQITYKNGEIKEYYGKNDFPNNFEYLDKIKNDLINKIIGE